MQPLYGVLVWIADKFNVPVQNATLDSQFPIARLWTAASSLVRLLLSLAFVFWLYLIVDSGQPNLTDAVYQETVGTQTFFYALFLAYGIYLLATRKLPAWTPLGWSAIGLIAAYVLAIVASPSWRVSAENSMPIAVCVVAFYIFNERRLFSTSLLVRSLMVATGVICVHAMFQMVQIYSDWGSAVETIKGVDFGQLLPPPALRLQSVLHHPNILAMFLDMALPFALVLVLQPHNWVERWSVFAVLVLATVAMFFTQSRGAWLGTMVSQPLFWLLYLMRNEAALSPRLIQEWLHRNKKWLRKLLMVLAGLLGLIVIAVAVIQPPWLFRATLGSRLETIGGGLRMVRDHPMTGVGPQVFDVLKGAYGIHKLQWIHTHNAYVQVLTDTGILGAVVVLIGGTITARVLLKAWRAAAPHDRATLAACVAAIVAILVHGLVDTPQHWISVLLPFAMVLAIALRFAPEPTPKPRGISRLPNFVAIGLIPLIMVGWWAMDGAHSHYDKSISASAAGDMQHAAHEAIAAVDADPHSLVYKLQAGISLVTLSQDETNAATWPGALQQGIEYLRGATEEDPHNGMAFANLGLALQMAGDDEGAAEAARRALTEIPEDVTIATVAGSIFEHAGLTNEAIDAYGAAMHIDASLAQSPYWGTTDTRQSVRAQVLAASELDACELGRQAGIYGVYVDELPALTSDCREIVDAPGGKAERPDLAIMLFAQGQTEEASAEADEALKALGRNADTLVMSSLVLSDGDLAQARSDLFDAFAHADAAALLAYTYSPAAVEPVAVHVALPQHEEQMPALIEKRLRSIVPADADSPQEVMTGYRLGQLYYVHIALREAPELKIIPGEWTRLVSPNVLLAFDALHPASIGQ